jgi:two-component system chemotaxis response regulator CheB
LSRAEERSVRRDIVVIGASAGGVDALQALVMQLRPDFPGSIFITMHMVRERASVLPQILGKASLLPILVPHDRQVIARGTVYVAVPDHHLALESGRVRVVKAPMQHRHRPAIDVLFQTAAEAYSSRVIGVVLTGLLDDGSAGLLAIKRRGGIAIVQDPRDAMYSDMPQNALRTVGRATGVDHCVPLAEIPRLLRQLAHEGAAAPVARPTRLTPMDTTEMDFERLGRPSAYSCPDCHGVLWEIADPEMLRLRCRVGHAYSGTSLLDEQSGSVEDALWAAVRSLSEQAGLARQMAEQWRTRDMPQAVAMMEEKAERSEAYAAKIRELLLREEENRAAEE